MTLKQKQRWKLECDIMKRLEHRHVVQARDIPDVLNKYSGELPLMGMEYCSGGDLRKVDIFIAIAFNSSVSLFY